MHNMKTRQMGGFFLMLCSFFKKFHYLLDSHILSLFYAIAV